MVDALIIYGILATGLFTNNPEDDLTYAPVNNDHHQLCTSVCDMETIHARDKILRNA